MFQDPKGYKVQMNDVHLYCGTNKLEILHFFGLIPFYTYQFS